MKKKHFLRALSIVLTVILVFGMGACAPAPTQDNTDATVNVNSPIPVGMLLLSTDAVLQVVYNAAGRVTTVEGVDKQGQAVASAYTDYIGKECAAVVDELLRLCAYNGYLTDAVKTVAIKQVAGSKIPSESFLEEIGTQAQNTLDAAGSTAKIVTISLEQLHRKGYIGSGAVKTLLQSYLGLEKLEKYSCGDEPEGNIFSCTLSIDGKKHHYDVDADTGKIKEVVDPENEDASLLEEDQAEVEDAGADSDGGEGVLELNVISFNVRCISSEDTGVKSWKERSVPLAQYLLDLDADIICMQECGLKSQYNFMKDALSDAYDVYRCYDGKSAGNVTALRKDAFNVLEDEIFWLSETPQTYSIGWDAKHPRVCHYFALQHKETGIKFNVFNTHLDHVGKIAPVRSMELITERIKACSDPCILTGDFNEDQQTQTYQIAMGVLQDTQKTAAVTESGRTYNRWGQNPLTGPQVDFILVSKNVTPLSFRICRERWNGTNLYSDHYAVQSVIRLTA